MNFGQEFLTLSASADVKMIEILGGDKAYVAKVKKRGAKRGSVTKTINLVEQNFPSTAADLRFYVDKLSNLQATLNSMDEAIDTFLLANDRMDDDQFAESYGICERYDDNINRCIAALKNELKIIETHNSNVETIV